MFTGIVRGIGTVTAIEKKQGLHTIEIEFPAGAAEGLELGASVAVDGVCLTVCRFSDTTAAFDVMQQTLQTTTLGALEKGSRINIERAAKADQEIGGHQLSGHVDCTASVVKVERPENNHVLTMRVPEQWRKYLFAKGYIAVNGASLTIASCDRRTGDFTVWLIPETLRLTTFGEKGHDAVLNIEVDRTTQILVDTVYGFLEERLASRDFQALAASLALPDRRSSEQE